MSEQREMTLQEWVERLPECHLARRHYAELLSKASTVPAEAVAWVRAIDRELVNAHLGVANTDDSIEVASAKLNELIRWHVDVATDPRVNGGYKLVEQTTPAIDIGKLRELELTSGQIRRLAQVSAGRDEDASEGQTVWMVRQGELSGSATAELRDYPDEGQFSLDSLEA